MTRRNRRSGFALVLATAFALLLLSLWALVFRELGAVLKIQSAQAARIEQAAMAPSAMASALTLLETLPSVPQPNYTCLSHGTKVEFHLREDGTWQVTFSSPHEEEVIPDMPPVYPSM